MLTVLAFVLTAWAFAFTVHAGNVKSFAKSCLAVDGQFYGQDKVGFYCMTTNVEQFDYKYSMIDLRHCLANNGGSLMGYRDGNYHQSCMDCQLRVSKDSNDEHIDTCHLVCDCYDTNGQKHQTNIDLGDVLENSNGRLTCYGHGGTKEQYPPECHHNPECDDGNPRLSP